MSKVLYISSEAFPLIKTGGLGDVAGSLPAALLNQSQDVRLLLPA
jgi:starch synthase